MGHYEIEKQHIMSKEYVIKNGTEFDGDITWGGVSFS